MTEADAAELRAALDTQAALQRETDHRVKNTLQLISSLLMLQGRRAKDDAAQAALKSALQRVSAVSVAARHVERIDGAERTEITALVRELATDLVQGARRDDVAVELDLDPLDLPARQAAPLALILTEALNNALSHGLDGRGGHVEIAVRRDGDDFVLSVADDGVGVAEGGPAKGFGLTIAGLMAQQLRGRLETECTQPGFRLAVHVPMDKTAP